MIRLVEIDPIALDNYVRDNHPEANFLQSAGWGKVYQIDGEKVFGNFSGTKSVKIK